MMPGDPSALSALADVQHRLTCLQAAAKLVAMDHASFFPGPDGYPVLGLMCGDTFAWGTADCELVTMDEAPKFLAMAEAEGYPALIEHIAKVRGSVPIVEAQRSMDTARALHLVSRERRRQDAKWGEQNHEPTTWAVILFEECGEVAKAVLERKADEYANELVQSAAVAVAAVECQMRRERTGVPA